MKWKKWRVVEPHPEDRYEPDDDVINDLRKRLREIEDAERIGDISTGVVLEQRRLRMELAERLYGT